MARRMLQRIVAHVAEPVRPMTLVGWAVGLGLVPTLVLRLRVVDAGPGRYGRAAAVLVVAAFGAAAAAAVTFLVRRVGSAWYRFASRHRRAAWTVRAVAAAWALLLAAAGAIALGWSGEPAGAVATVLVKALGAGAIGTGSAALSLAWVLARVRRPAVRLAAAGLALYLSVTCFLFFEHSPAGGGMLLVPLILAFLWTAVMRATPAGPGAILGFALLFAAAAAANDRAAGAETARLAVQAVIAVVLGAATVHGVRRGADRLGPLRRFAGAAAIVPLGYVMFAWFDGQLLGGPLAVPLFAPMLWLVVRLWRRLLRDSRPAVAAAADLVFAVLLGTVLVLFLVWLANVLDLPVVEVSALRGAAGRLGDLIDLPWWTWAGADVLLAAAFLTAALGPRGARRLAGALDRIRLRGALDVLRRTLSVLKIGLLSLVFVGLAAPPAVGPVLSRHLRARYTAALQQDLAARDEAALYQEITLRFGASPQALPALTRLLTDVYDTAGPGSDRGEPTAAARDLAHRMGELQARTLLPFAPPGAGGRPGEPPGASAAAAGAAAAAARAAGMDGTAADAADLTARLTREQREREDSAEREEAAEHAAEHAAAAVTGALGTITLGHGVVIALVREYLDGLAESGLSTVFGSWARRALPRPAPAGAPGEPPADQPAEPPTEPPTAVRLVEPDQQALRAAADAQLAAELLSTGVLPGTDPAQSRADRESPIAAAVHLAAHTRGLQRGTARCEGCAHFFEPGGGEHGFEEGGIHGE